MPAIARCLRFDPVLGGRALSRWPAERKIAWLDAHRKTLEDAFLRAAGSSPGGRKTYREVVIDTARRFGALFSPSSPTADIEQALLGRIWSQAVRQMTPRLRAALEAALPELARSHTRERAAASSTISARPGAKCSSLAISLIGTVLLAAGNSRFGWPLGCKAFTPLSPQISALLGAGLRAALEPLPGIGPGGPEQEKVLPVILQIVAWRAQAEPRPAAPSQPLHDPPPEAAPAEQPARAPGLAPPPAQPLAEARPAAAGSASRRNRPDPARALRRPTALEKIIFNLQHPELSQLARRFANAHFLELSEPEQAALRELHRESLTWQPPAGQPIAEPGPNPRKPQAAGASPESGRPELARASVEEELLRLANLSFTDEALQRLRQFSRRRQQVILEKLRQIHDGNIRSKHVVPNTDPRVFQRDAARDLRIYYRRDGAPNRFLIRLIGTKSTQEADYRAMRQAG